MVRKIIKIDEKLCNGCGICATACHEGAIGMVDGKARLLREDYCDGLGDCLPACPVNAISFEEREAPAYDEAAVKAAQAERERERIGLSQWPIQLKLVPVSAPYFNGADLLVAADCTAYAYGRFHQDFIRNKVTLIGCPKLDPAGNTEKLLQIIMDNEIRSITVVRMEVPCCGGMEWAIRRALEAGGKLIPLNVVTITIEGEIKS